MRVFRVPDQLRAVLGRRVRPELDGDLGCSIQKLRLQRERGPRNQHTHMFFHPIFAILCNFAKNPKNIVFNFFVNFLMYELC